MDWASIAILGTVLIGVVNILDSHLVARRMPSLKSFLLLVVAVITIPTLAAVLIFPLPEGLEGEPLAVAIGSSILRNIAILILLYVYKTEEVSQAIPIFHTFPVFVAVLAVPLLGETINGWQWLAVFIVVAGTIIISTRSIPGRITYLRRPFWLLLASSFLIALSDVGSKYALDYMSFWNVYWLGSVTMIAIFLAIALRSSVIKELLKLPDPHKTLPIVAGNEVLAITGIVLIFWAFASGPVSLVDTINGSRPLFVLGLAVLLNRLAPGFLLKGQPAAVTIRRRLVATLMIVGGIAIIYLT